MMTSHSVLLPLAALAAAVVAPMPSMMTGMYPPMMPMGHVHGHHEAPRRQMLTCQLNFRSNTNPGTILNSIAVTIKERAPDASSLMTSMLGGSYGKVKPGMHGAGLSASIGIFSSTGGAVKVALTEAARPQDGCKADDFGHFLRSKSSMKGMMSPMMGGMMYPAMGGMMGMGYKSTSYKSSSYSPFGMHKSVGSSAYPTLGGYGGVMGGYPMMGGMMMGYPMMHHTHDADPEAVLASHTLAPGVKASINIDRVRGFNSLAELAGRGIVVCPKDKVDVDGYQGECEGGILSCCALHYDREEVVLGGN